MTINLDSEFASTAASPTFATLPDGTYDAVVTRVQRVISTSSNPMLLWSITITRGTHAGAVIAKTTTMPTERQSPEKRAVIFGFLKADLLYFGLACAYRDIETNLRDLAEAPCVVSVAERRGHQHVAFIGRPTAVVGAPKPAAGGPTRQK